ncbi:U4/U6 small nuclear ribonucleoprotein prp4 [Thecaphora frezii]
MYPHSSSTSRHPKRRYDELAPHPNGQRKAPRSNADLPLHLDHAQHHERRDRDRRTRFNLTPSSDDKWPREQNADRDRSRNQKAEEGEIIADNEATVNAQQTKSDSAAQQELDDFDYDLDEDQRAEKLLEEGRKRRQAILQKYSATASPVSSVDHASPALVPKGLPESLPTQSDPRKSNVPASGQAPGIVAQGSRAGGDALETLAVEKDHSAKRREEEARQKPEPGHSDPLPLASMGLDEAASRGNAADIAAGLGEPIEKDAEEEYEEIEVDDEDDVDMFALDNEERPKKKKKILRVAKGSGAALPPVIASEADPSATTLNDNWDDPDGYYRIILGETLDKGRYQVFANLGKGMFSSVVRARDLQNAEREVAIKIVRIQETMYKAGLKEIGVLKKLAELDPDDKKHVIRLEGHFEHRGHLCMVFESLSMNLREVVKRFGKDVGLNLLAVKAYAHQMFAALSLLRKANLMHADIKPDNILVNDAKNHLKVCDLGSASDLSEMEITPYLVSRFYRAPEIILGQPYDCAIDVWSIGCTLYELATGKILFPGRSNNQMLLLMQEVKGKFTTRQIRRGQFGEQHFDDTNAFLSSERDKSTGQSIVRRVVFQKPTSDLKARLLPAEAARRLKEGEVRMHTQFIDLLNRCLELDPAKRITPREALVHAFFST